MSLQKAVLTELREFTKEATRYKIRETQAFSNTGCFYFMDKKFGVDKWMQYNFQNEYCSFTLSDDQHKPDKLRLGYIEFKKNELKDAIKKVKIWIKSQ